MEKPPKTKWTIMIYLAGDNDLTPFCINVLQQLEAVKYRDDVCVLACFDSNTPWPKGSRYFTINCPHRSRGGQFNWEIHNDLVPPNGKRPVREPNFFDDDYETRHKPFERPVVAEGLKTFINWAVRGHAGSKDKDLESENFMLILFGHGPIVAGQSFLMASNPPSYLQMSDLKEVLDPHFGPNRKLDILAFQNCAMNGIEMAWEIRDYVDVMIGSQGLVLANGWPYEEILSNIVKRPDDKPMEVAQMMLKTCARNLLDFAIMGRSSEQSACDIRSLREESQIMGKLRELVTALKKGLEFKNEEKKRDEEIKKQELAYPAICDAITLARLEAQSYFGELYVDLYDFCERLIKKCNRIFLDHQSLLSELKLLDETSYARLRNSELIERTLSIINCCLAVRKELEENLVKKGYSYYIGSQLQYSRGLSIYFPWTVPNGRYFPKRKRTGDYRLNTPWDIYNTYSFVKQSNWTDFLSAFFMATLRGVRRNDLKIELNDNPTLGEGLTDENQPQDDSLKGLVKMDYPPMQNDVLVTDLQKSSPDTGGVDSDLWFSIKNYPRQNYLSPADTQRAERVREIARTETRLEMETTREKESPLVTPHGWHITGLVAEVIRKESSEPVPDEPLTNAASS